MTARHWAGGRGREGGAAMRVVPDGGLADGLSVGPDRAPGSEGPGPDGPSLELVLDRVARGDEAAFEVVYDRMAGTVLGVSRSVLRDPHQAEEVAQEVLLDVWRQATRFDASRGSARAWICTMAHRRAVDRVRSTQAARTRDAAAAARSGEREFDEVSEQVQTRLEAEQLRHCLEGLTPRQKETVTLAYYGGNTYPQVATLLKLPLGTVKTRMRDGLIRLRDCLGVGSDD